MTVLLLAFWGMAQAMASLPPVHVERWELAGDRLIDAEEASALFAPSISPDSAAVILAGRLVSAGWWGARVTAVTGPPIVTLRIEAGEPVVVGDVGVHGNRLLTREEILSRVETRPGSTFEEATFRADAERVLRAYSEAGHALARVYPSSFRRTPEGRLGFTLRIGEGPATTVESVRVFGRTATSDAVVARIAGVRPGDSWNVRRFEGMSARLRREGLFRSVGEPRLVRGSRDNLVGVEIEIEEGPANSFAGILGYNPDPAGGGEVVGLVHLDLRNILGTARRASLRFERQSPEFRDLAFRYREPWLLGSPLSLELGAAQSLRDPLYSRTDLDAGLSVPIGDRSTVTVTAERRETSFDEPSGVDVSETSTGGSAALAHDARDRRLNPGGGWAARLLIGARETEEAVLRSRAELDVHVLVPAGSSWVLSEELGFRGVRSTSGSPPLSEQYYLGGTNTVRGYREEQFHGDRVWWARSELRYRLSLRSRAYVFADVGAWRFGSDGAAPGDSDVIPGGGVGISLETRSSGFVRFELALGRGDGFSDAKVHAALEQEF
ncbi:MAG: BamA/OMP85 family outer membrane protein [Candidatus Eiseniibacteriota bacterium]